MLTGLIKFVVVDDKIYVNFNTMGCSSCMACMHHSVLFKVSLNTSSIIYQIVKQLHVSVLRSDRHQACINYRKVYFIMYTALRDLIILRGVAKF